MAPLRAHLNALVRLCFKDGEVVEARLLGVDEAAHDDLTYEVRRVVTPSAGARGTTAGAVVAAPLAELESWAPIAG